ncbi:MAG: WecB/TagA/CpsF family glycosyltransferase, partial [Armatimonadota bacterium]|nr:WecB/TagA/CpsF family glycosyltransferase [Armatimonadota bacterium]
LPVVDLLGVPVHPISLPEAVAFLEEAVVRRRPATVISLNGALLVRALRDRQLREAVCAATLVIPDGVGVVLAARILGVPLHRRLPGVDLAEALCAAVAARCGRVFLLGAAPGVAEAALERLRQRYPGLEGVGVAHGFFRPEEEAALLARIARARPDVLLVALGAPRQEQWMHQHAPALGVPVVMGVGGTLDVLAGRARRAPRWVQTLGLEWLYRAAREPWRWSVVRTIPPLFLVALRERLRAARRYRSRTIRSGGTAAPDPALRPGTRSRPGSTAK